MEDLSINEQNDDDLTGVEPEHFIEFEQVAAAAAEMEGDQLPLTGQSTSGEGYQPTQAAEMSGAELLAPLVSLAFGLLAPNWNVAAEEQQAIAESYGALVDKYYPEGAGTFGVELNALILTAAIVGPRLGTPRKLEKTIIDTKKEAANDDASSEKTG